MMNSFVKLGRGLGVVGVAAIAASTLGVGVAHADWHDHRHWRHDRGGYYAPYYAPPPPVYYAPPPPPSGLNLFFHIR